MGSLTRLDATEEVTIPRQSQGLSLCEQLEAAEQREVVLGISEQQAEHGQLAEVVAGRVLVGHSNGTMQLDGLLVHEPGGTCRSAHPASTTEARNGSTASARPNPSMAPASYADCFRSCFSFSVTIYVRAFLITLPPGPRGKSATISSRSGN